MTTLNFVIVKSLMIAGSLCSNGELEVEVTQILLQCQVMQVTAVGPLTVRMFAEQGVSLQDRNR